MSGRIDNVMEHFMWYNISFADITRCTGIYIYTSLFPSNLRYSRHSFCILCASDNTMINRTKLLREEKALRFNVIN